MILKAVNRAIEARTELAAVHPELPGTPPRERIAFHHLCAMKIRTLTAAIALSIAVAVAPARAQVDPVQRLQQTCHVDPYGSACAEGYLKLVPPGSAAQLDSTCMTAHAPNNPADMATMQGAICHQVLGAVLSTADTIGRWWGKPLVCSATPLAAEQLELVFTQFAHKLVKDDYATYSAEGSAAKVALAAFMTVYPCAAK